MILSLLGASTKAFPNTSQTHRGLSWGKRKIIANKLNHQSVFRHVLYLLSCHAKLSVHHIDIGLHALFSCPFCANIDGVHISRRSFSALEVCGT